MLNSAKCSFARELGRPFPSRFYEAIGEDALTESSLIPKPLSLPAATKTTFFIATSPDGKLIASAHGDHCVYVCNILQGKVIHRLAGHARSPWALAFHPSRSDLLASGCLGGEVRVWDLKTGCSESLHLDNEDAVVPGASAGGDPGGSTVYTASVAIASVAFHPDERLLAIAAGDRLIFWDWSCKYPRGECRTASARERVRYVKFDRTGILYTGITNSRQVVTTTASAGTETEPARPAMASTPPEVMPYRCRELLTSRNEILQMRAELSRRHEQLLQRYNDLLRRYQELRERYPDIHPSNSSQNLPSRRVLPPPPSPPPPPPAAPRRWLDETDGGQRFISLMEENRRLGLEGARAHLRQSEAGNDLFEGSSNRPETPMSPIQLERLDEPESYAREMANSSLQRFERRHNLSYDRLCRSYRAMSESAQRLVMEFQRVYGEYVTMKEEVRRRTGTLEQHRGAQYETGRAVLSTLAQMQVIMLSGDITPNADAALDATVEAGQQARRRGGEARGWQWSEERRMYERVQREARTLMRVHDLLLELRNRLDFQADVVDDLRRGRDRLERLILELSQTAPGGSLEALHQRLVTEIRHFKLFIRQWKQVVMSNLTTSASSSSSRQSEESSAGTSSFVRLSLSPEARNEPNQGDGPSTSGSDQATSGAAMDSAVAGTSTVSKRVANILVSPLRKRPSATDNGNQPTADRRSIEPMTSIRLPLPPPVVNLSPSRTVETPGPLGGTTYHYSYPYSPPHRSEDRQQGAGASEGAPSSSSQSADHSVPIKRRRLNFGQVGESSASSAASTAAPSEITQSSFAEAAPDLNRAQPLPNFGPLMANSASTQTMSTQTGQTAATMTNQTTVLQRRERPNIVLYVPRESSRLAPASTSTGSTGSQGQQDRSASSALNELGARVGGRRYVMVGSPPRFERVNPMPGYAYRGLTHSLVRQSGQEQPSGAGASRDRATGRTQATQAGGGDNNNNDDEWEYSYDLNRAVNRAIAGAFIGAGDMALANNILDMTCRIQRWSSAIDMGKYPDLAQSESNIVVSKCKLHNDGSVSVNESGTLLAAFVENSAPDRSLWAHTTLKIVSLRPEDRGTVLYEKTFGPNAISVSFSPADGRHILIGLASRRYLRLRHSPQTCAMVFSLRDLHENRYKRGQRRSPGELKLSMNVEHEQRPSGTLFGGGVVGQDEGSNFLTWGFRVDSINCAVWLPTPGQGLCYGTNRGQIFILTPKREEPDETDSSSPFLLTNIRRPMAPFQRQLARWNMFEDNQQGGAGDVELVSGNGNLIV